MSCCIKTSLDCNEIRNVSPSSAHVCAIGQMSEGRRGWKIPAVVATELYTPPMCGAAKYGKWNEVTEG